MGIAKKDMDILRQLAEKYMQIATQSVQKEKIDLWKSINRGDETRPMVVIDQLPWNQLNKNGELSLTVSDPFWQKTEAYLRKKIYMWEHFPADMVIEPFIPFEKAVCNSMYGIGVSETTLAVDPTGSVVSHKYNNQMKNEESVLNIMDMEITHDISETETRKAKAEQIFGSIAPCVATGISFHLGIWDFISLLMGVENVYFDLIDRPEFIHKVMRRLTDATISGIKKADELGVHNDITNICHCSYIYTDEFLPGSGQGKGGHSKNCWAFGMAQLFSSVSPDITKEFEVPYIFEMAQHFGGIYYGCCEKLDDRIELVSKIPNVRKISCSPWSNKEAFAERLPKNIIMSYKPNPAVMATDSLDFDYIKKEIESAASAARKNNLRLEIILKDISTVKFNPKKLSDWNNFVMGIVNG